MILRSCKKSNVCMLCVKVDFNYILRKHLRTMRRTLLPFVPSQLMSVQVFLFGFLLFLIQPPTGSQQGFFLNFASPLLLPLSWQPNGGRPLLFRLFSNEPGVIYTLYCTPGSWHRNDPFAFLSWLKPNIRQKPEGDLFSENPGAL